MLQTLWRRERDSNPRYPFRYSSFQDCLFQPLTHPSAFNFNSPRAAVRSSGPGSSRTPNDVPNADISVHAPTIAYLWKKFVRESGDQGVRMRINLALLLTLAV